MAEGLKALQQEAATLSAQLSERRETSAQEKWNQFKPQQKLWVEQARQEEIENLLRALRGQKATYQAATAKRKTAQALDTAGVRMSGEANEGALKLNSWRQNSR